ncbi:hypothetical protein P9112_006472 [Eukaryota sp. TZLM1-RC]
MLPYIPYTIAPIVLETFEICHGIDPRVPSAILTHLLSMCQLEDPASVYHRFQSLRLSLSAPTVNEAVTSYISEFLKLVRLCPSPLPESAKMKFFSNGIRPDKLKMVIKTDIEVGSIYSFASLVSRLRELLPAYHLPYSAYYANRDIAPPPSRDSRPPRRSSASPRTTRQPPRNSSSRPAPSSAKPPASSYSQRSTYSTPTPSSPMTCFYCKEPGHMIKDCPKSGCKASQKPRRRPLGKKPSLQRKHFTRRSVNQVTHAAHDDRPDSVNSIIDSIQEAIQEDHRIDATYLHGLSSSSSSSSDNEPYRATLNPFSTINHSTYSSSLHQHSAMVHQQAEDFQHLFNNLESFTSALASRDNALTSPYPSPSDSGLDSSSDSLSEAPEVVSKVDSNSHMVPPGNAPSRQNGSLLLEASPDLSSEPGMIDADCARHDGGVTRGPLESHLQNSSKAEDSESLRTAPAQSFEPFVSLSAQELNKPLDKKLLHLKIYVESQTMLNGMVDTGATVSCISHDLLKQAKLKLTSKTLEVGLSDKIKLSCPLASGKLAFALDGAAKLTYVNVTLAVLQNSNRSQNSNSFENGQRRIDPSKIESITKLAPPSSVPELRSFIGSVNFLRDWLPSVSAEIEPLTALLRNKPRRVRLGPAELKNFENIKNMITRSLPLALPDSDSNILISTDASEKAIAGIIWKELEPSPPETCLSKRKVMPISFYSRILSSSQQRWSTLQKELFAIVMTLNQPNLSSFLLTRHLTIFCDHKNLLYLFSCPDSNRVVLRWIPVLQSFSFDCVHIEGPKNFWADYLSRASLLPEKKEKKTRDICDNSTPKLCCMMTYQDQAKSPLWNYLNLDDLRHFDTDRWYDIDYVTAERILHPSALRSKHSTMAYLNSLKHFIHYNVNPEPYDYLASSSAKYFILSTDLPFLYKDVSAPKDYDFSYPLNLPSRYLTVNDIIQQANWNARVYFHHPRMPFLDYLPEVVPQNAHLIVLNHAPPRTTIGDLLSAVDIFHIVPLPTYMVPFDLGHNRYISDRFLNVILLPDAKGVAHDFERNLWYRATTASERYVFHDLVPPRCNPQECPDSPRCDHYPWTPDTIKPCPYGDQLYDCCLHPQFHKYSDLPCCNVPIGPLYPDSDYRMYLLNPCADVTTYIPLCLLKPIVHRIYHYDNDELSPCLLAIPGIKLVYGDQIDPSDRSIHCHLMPLDYSSVAEAEFDNPDPDFIHDESTTCSHFPDLINMYFNGPIQHHSRLDFIFQDKRLEIVPHPTHSHAFALPGYPADQPRYYLPSFTSELPSRLEIFEANPSMFDHERFLKEQSMSPAEGLPSREDPDQPIDVSSDSSDEVHLVSTITSSSTSDSSVQELLPSSPPSSPAAAFLNKIFKDQQKVPDNDPLFKDCIIEAKSGLKLTKSGKILIPPSTRPEILLLAHGSIEAGHPPFAQCWKSLQQSDFHWPNMRNDLQTHVNACIFCQKTAPVPKTLISSTGSLNSVRRPFESLHCDSIGPLSVDSYGYRYIVHFVDAFSKCSILVPTKDLKALTVANSLISSVYSIFGAPRHIHSDNGPEFANKIFSLLCQFLNVEHTQSLPHYHQSNGLVERQHRSFLQVIRRMLLDFSDYDNWSDYVPLCQMVLNSQERKALNASPYSLIFGSDTSPRLLPNQLLTSFASHPLPADKPEFIEHLVTLTKKLLASWDAVTQSSAPPPADIPEPPYIPQVNDRVFVLREKPDKLHGHFVGPYIVLKVLSSSSLLVQNPVSGSSLKTATHLVKPCLSSLPPEILNAYVAADSGELILDAIIDISDDSATVLWSDGTTTVQPVSSIRNTAAYSRYSKLAADPPKSRRKRKRRQC